MPAGEVGNWPTYDSRSSSTGTFNYWAAPLVAAAHDNHTTSHITEPSIANVHMYIRPGHPVTAE